MEEWETEQREELVETPIFRLDRVVRRTPDERAGEFWALELPDWVNVVAETADDEIVLVRQYRHGTDEVTVEIPGGAVDSGETARRAAERELQEETGFVAEAWSEIGRVEPNPAFMGNECSVWVAEEARRTGEPNLDEFEEIEVDLVPRSDFFRMVDDGEIRHALVVAAAYYLGRQ